MVIDTETYRFTFGKYKGKTYKWVRSCNPFYILWCHDCVEWFTLSKREEKNICTICSKKLLSRLREDMEYKASEKDDDYSPVVFRTQAEVEHDMEVQRRVLRNAPEMGWTWSRDNNWEDW